ncbi:MAG: hypothetical protein AAF703_01315 [Cyanobacteria bacterium P01_D01_bin.105]
MPKPCSKPLRQNPFESYRDPVTGQWKVRYPASSLPAAPSDVQSSPVAQTGNVQSDPVQAGSVQSSPVQPEAAPARRRWKTPSRKTKVA